MKSQGIFYRLAGTALAVSFALNATGCYRPTGIPQPNAPINITRGEIKFTAPEGLPDEAVAAIAVHMEALNLTPFADSVAGWVLVPNSAARDNSLDEVTGPLFTVTILKRFWQICMPALTKPVLPRKTTATIP